MAGLLFATLPGLPDPPIELLIHDNRYVVRAAGTGKDRIELPLRVNGEVLANLNLSVACQPASTGKHLAVHRSSYGLTATVDRTPLVRIEYFRDMNTAPTAHVHVHGQRGALSHLLSRAGHRSPHDISALHIPVGGSRFRPCLEDFIQFLIMECKFDSKPDWRNHVDAGRERWRLLQAATVVRDMPEEAARVLKELGYTVQAPDPPPPTSAKALHAW